MKKKIEKKFAYQSNHTGIEMDMTISIFVKTVSINRTILELK